MASHPEPENPAGVTEIQVRVDCNGCVQKINKALHGINGIYDLYVDFPHQKLTIVVGCADPERIVKAIRKTRKTAIIISSSSSSHVEQKQPADTPPPPPPQPPDHHENDDDVLSANESSNPPAAADSPPPPPEPSPPPPPSQPSVDPQPPAQAEHQNQQPEENLPSNQHHPLAGDYPPRRQGDAGEVHFIYHHDHQPPPPPDHYGYRYGAYGSSTPGYHQFERYRDGPVPLYPQVPPPQMERQPVYVTNHSPQVPPQMERQQPVYVTHQSPQVPMGRQQPVYLTHQSPRVPPPQMQQQPVYVTTHHSYNTYRPSPYVTEYEYVRTAMPAPPPQQQQPRYTHNYSRMDYYSEEYHDVNPPSNGNITSMFSDENPNSCTVM